MRLLVIIVIAVVIGVVLMSKHNFFTAVKRTPETTGEIMKREGGIAPEVGRAHEQDDGKEKKEPTHLIYYKFLNRPVPSTAGGVVDLADNSLTAEVELSKKNEMFAEWVQKDTAVPQVLVQLDVIELTTEKQDGFSLAGLVGTFTTALESFTAKTGSPAVVGGDFLVSLIAQSSPHVRARLKVRTKIALTMGQATLFSQFTEQADTTTTTTQTSTTTTPNRRDVGLNISLQPIVLRDLVQVDYKVDNTTPTSESLAAGDSLQGRFTLSKRVPTVLVDALHTAESRSTQVLFGLLPTGSSVDRLSAEDVIVIQDLDATRVAVETKVPKKKGIIK